MKRIAFFLAVMFFVHNASAQNPYKPLCECNFDALTYLEHNFGFHNREVLDGKTIGEFLEISDLTFETLELEYATVNSSGTTIIGINIYLQPYDYVTSNNPGKKIFGLNLSFSTPLTEENAKDIFNNFLIDGRKIYPLNSSNLYFFLLLKIKKCAVVGYSEF